MWQLRRHLRGSGLHWRPNDRLAAHEVVLELARARPRGSVARGEQDGGARKGGPQLVKKVEHGEIRDGGDALLLNVLDKAVQLEAQVFGRLNVLEVSHLILRLNAFGRRIEPLAFVRRLWVTDHVVVPRLHSIEAQRRPLI